MTASGHKRLIVVLTAALVVSLAAAGKIFWDAVLLRLRVSFASEQIAIFEEMRSRALSAEGSGAAQHLEYVVNYYPSGTKQIAGSRLDGIVERARTNAIRDIITHLREKTGENLGDDTEKWIQKYAPR
jgi:hypothetical protein